MSNIAAPFDVLVRPRVFDPRLGESRPLVDVLSELIEEDLPSSIWIEGGPGSGKSTALAYVAKALGAHSRFVFLDEPSTADLVRDFAGRVVVATCLVSHNVRRTVLRLSPWGVDEIVEYLLATHRDACVSVVQRLGDAASGPWSPRAARIVLDRFAADPSRCDASAALADEIRERLPDVGHFALACRYCLALQADDRHGAIGMRSDLLAAGCAEPVLRLLHDRRVKLPLAVAAIASGISLPDGHLLLEHPLPSDVLTGVASKCLNNAPLMESLRRVLNSRTMRVSHAMAASIMVRADSAWRPSYRFLGNWRLWQGRFAGVDWRDVVLVRAHLQQTDFSGAKLEGAVLIDADAKQACFAGAALDGAKLDRLHAPHADFQRASLKRCDLTNAFVNGGCFVDADLTEARLARATLLCASFSGALLHGADLTGAQCVGADFEDADLSCAILRQATLPRVDLRNAILHGACFDDADLHSARFDEVPIRQAQFRRANLTDACFTHSSMPEADFFQANLSGTRLAYVNWEGAVLEAADLRGATFHMGSSRSGLVGSPIAREGSMTGFYTDDRDETYFKRPEEIRKANLCGVDLRGARIDDVDFYLVDLRGATLDGAQRDYLQRCRAILDD